MTSSDDMDRRAAERVIDLLERGATADGRLALFAEEGEAEIEARLYTELLGLLPLELAERPPSAALKGRLMAAIGAGAESAAATPPAPAVASLETARERRAAAAVPPRRAPLVWRLAAAAGFIALVGLALFSGYLYGRLGERDALLAEQQQTISRLASSLAEMQNQATAVAASQQRLASHLALVATPGTVLCPLRPSGDDPMYPRAYGLLFLSETHDGWFIRVSDVGAPPPGQAYRLWFLVGDEMHPMGVMLQAADGMVELEGRGLPPPGTMRGAFVTLEAAEPSTASPSGPRVLFGDERVEMI